MLKTIKHTVLYILVTWLVFTIGCTDKEGGITLTDQQNAAQLLSGSWGHAEILDSPVPDSNGSLESLELTFSVSNTSNPGTFSATGAESFFSTITSSSWSWEDDGTTTSLLFNNVSPISVVTVYELTETTFTIGFNFDGPVGGRIDGVGEYRIKLTKL